MKRTYETPVAEKIAFRYQEQVAASIGNCTSLWTNIGDLYCEGEHVFIEKQNL